MILDLLRMFTNLYKIGIYTQDRLTQKERRHFVYYFFLIYKCFFNFYW